MYRLKKLKNFSEITNLAPRWRGPKFVNACKLILFEPFYIAYANVVQQFMY